VNKGPELWQFVADRLKQGRPVMLLVVAESSGSSPGRQGYKMAVGDDGELWGSIGGGVMEVGLVELSRKILHDAGGLGLPDEAGSSGSFLKPQVHQKNSPTPSGMICSGRQTVIFKTLGEFDLTTVQQAAQSLMGGTKKTLLISDTAFELIEGAAGGDFEFETKSDIEFEFRERLGRKDDLYIIGGGHCALALSELMSKLDFYIRLFDDRPDLNTLDKNMFADEKQIISSYAMIGELVPSGPNSFVVVMTLGYRSDETAIRQLIDKNFKYFGVLGSKAKMSALFKDLRAEGVSAERLAKIHTPIGLPINSHTPEEIAVSIAAEMISIKNAS
jgi:xanthine dehydrogenase accessory factor